MAIETVYQNSNKIIQLDSTSGANYTKIYSPGTKDGIALDGYLTDFRIVAKIRSADTFIPPSPEALKTEQEINNINYLAISEAIAAGKGKILGIYTSVDGNENIKIWRFSTVLWNRVVQYSENLLKRLTENQSALISAGTTLWAKIETESGATVLAGEDKISIWTSAYEEGSINTNSTDFQQFIYTIFLQNAEEEYSFSVPNGTQGYSFKCRGDESAGDTISDIRFAWNPGKVNTSEGYDILPGSTEESEPYLPPTQNKILYLSSPVPNVVIVFKAWIANS